MATPKIGVIISTTRKARVADKPAQWLMDLASQRSDLHFELIDLRDYELPFFNEDYSLAMGPAQNPVAQKWGKRLAEFDGFIIIAAEYNHGMTAVLKNALDYAYGEWNRKPVAFFGYGGVGGARAIQQLKEVAVELQMAPVRHGVNLAGADFFALMQGQKEMSDFEYLIPSANAMFDHLAWWANTLKAGREG